MKKIPAFQFYPADWLSSQRVALLTLEEEGAYIRLLCYCWKNGELPNDMEQLAKLIGKGGSVLLATKVATMFQADGTRLLHDRLDELRGEREKWVEKSRQGGLASAAKRAKQRETGKTDSKGGCDLVEDCLQPKGNTTTSSSSSSIVTHTGEVPSRDEVVAYGEMIGLVEWKAEDWWLGMETKGWHMGATEVRNWQAGLTRAKQYWEADGRPMQRPGRNGTSPAANGTSTMPIWKKILVITESLATHPGNKESTYYQQERPEARAEYRKLKTKLKELKAEERAEAL